MLGRILIGLAALVVVVGVAVGITLHVTRAPDPGDFYDPPEIGPDAAPGTLLRSEPVTAGVPEGAEAWRILYVSRGVDDAPIAVSGLVLADREAGGGHPVLAWAHGTIGIARGCALTLLPDPSSAVPQLAAMLRRGWVVVATDYPGLGGPGVHPYLVGDVTGRSVIDSVRAARALDTGLELQRRYAVWGESQGGHAALFTGQVAAEGYAPELRLVGVGAAAPASDLAPLLKAAQGAPAGKVLTSQAVVSWTQIHPELSFDDTVVRRGRAPVRAVARRCLFPNLYVVAAQTIVIPKRMLAIDITTDPGWSARLAENTPSGRIDAPVLLAQGRRDQIVSPPVQRAYVARRCAAGQPIDFRELPESGHVNVMRAAGPLLLHWTDRLFAGTPVPEGCGTPRGG